MATTLPPLITEEGLVLNNMMPGEGALGNYTPPGTASSEGISLLMRGVLQAAKATGQTDQKNFAKFLFDSMCKHFFRGVRPTDEQGQDWNHSWIANGGAAFTVRGPLDPSGDLALSGYVYGRNPESTITLVDGVGTLNPAPDIVYQAVSADAQMVWGNVFSDLTQGQSYTVEYYIDSKGNKVFGAQKAGSFGQPSIPAGEHSDGAPGKIVLTSKTQGTVGVNYCITVPDVKVGYGELYEAWPMWRKLADNEVSTAADAIHWFLDAFALGKEVDPTNQDWVNAYNRMLEVWDETCEQESNNTRIFQAGASGPYNNFPLTYSYGYGRADVDDPTSNWDAIPPTLKYTAERTSDGYVTFTLPEESAGIGSKGSIRYGVAFENKPLFLTYSATSKFSVDIKSTISQTISMSIVGKDGLAFEASIPVTPTSGVQEIGVDQFYRFQQEPGDADGTDTGDWDGEVDPEPDYPAVPFPGRRVALVGDSITFYCHNYFPNQVANNRFGYYSFGYAGFWTYADQLMGGRTELEHGIQPNIGMQHTGYNLAVASSKVAEWYTSVISPGGVEAAGPMYAAMNNLGSFDMAYVMGGTNDLAGNDNADNILRNLKKVCVDLAKNGKWVFVGVIPPRSRDLLSGYTVAQQDVIRQRLQTVNQGLRDWVATKPNNIWLVDYYAEMVGPNGIDPAGTVSSPTGATDSRGNFRVDAPDSVFCHDGLHPSPAGAFVMGRTIADVMMLAGVPARTAANTLGPLSLGANLLPNPSMTFTEYPMITEYNQQGQPISWNFTRAGWATGLGAQLMSTGIPRRHLGYTYGKIPDNWHFYRCTNKEDQTIGSGKGGTFSNFMQYTFSDLSGRFPQLLSYMDDSTWPDGAITTEITTDAGVPAIRITVNIPQTGNKNEGFVLLSHVPQDQHGPWDEYGYTTPDKGPVHTNNVYNAGDMLQSEADVTITGMNNTLHSWRMLINILGIDPLDQTNVTSGAKISSIGNSHNFYPPSDIDKMRMHPGNKQLKMRSPVIIVPPYASGESRRYAQFKLEFSFDASAGPATAVIIVKNPSVRKVIGGTPL